MIEPQSLPKKALFIDEPFAEGESLRAKRSRFLWEIIATHFDADLLLLKSNIYQEKPVPTHKGHDKLFSLSLAEPNQLFPLSYHLLATGQANRFKHILDSRRYELIIFGGLSCLPLLYIARKALPRCKFIIDAERHYLPEAESKWKQNKSLANVEKLLEYARLKFWDKLLIKKDCYCFLANPADEAPMQHAYKFPADSIFVFPLPLEQEDYESSLPIPQSTSESRFILFWGMQSGDENLNAAKLMVSEIYPRISKKLVEKEIGIHLCGTQALEDVSGGRIKFTPAESTQDTAFQELLASALFVVLPLCAPDTEERILQCAAAGKAVVCTTIGIEGWNLPDNCAKVQDKAEDLAPHIIRWLQYPREAEASANHLRQYYHENYQAKTIKESILNKLNTWIEDYDQ